MTEREERILPELEAIAKNLSEDNQKILVRLGQDIIFMEKVKNGTAIG